MMIKCDIVFCVYCNNNLCMAELIEIVPDHVIIHEAPGYFEYITCKTYKPK